MEGPVQPGTVFRWKAGPSTLTSHPPGGRPAHRDRLDRHHHGAIRNVLAHLKVEAERRAARA